MEIGSIGIKLISKTYNIKVTDRLGKIFILSLEEGPFRFFSHIQNISNNPVEDYA
jgi:hypothetical protein